MVDPPAPRYLLDTNILVAFIRANLLGQWIEATYQLTAASLVPLICVVTEGEMHSLAKQFGWGANKVSQVDQLLSRFVSINLDFPNLIDTYAQIDDFSRRNGVTMGKNDVWIAATAAVTGATLLTTDQDFDHLDPKFLTRDYINPAS